MKKRIISAIIMILIFVPLLVIGELPFAIFMGILGTLGLYELLSVRESKKKFPFLYLHLLWFLSMIQKNII